MDSGRRAVRSGQRSIALDNFLRLAGLDERSKSSWIWNHGDVHLLAEHRTCDRWSSDGGGEEVGGILRGEDV